MADSKPAKGETPDSTPAEKRNGQKDNRGVQALAVVGGVALYVLLGSVLWWILDLYINPQDSGEKKDLVQALGLIMAGVAGVIGIYFTWHGQRITQESLDDTRKNTEENLRLTEQGQITERFNGPSTNSERPMTMGTHGLRYALVVSTPSNGLLGTLHEWTTARLWKSLQLTFGRTLLKLLGP